MLAAMRRALLVLALAACGDATQTASTGDSQSGSSSGGPAPTSVDPPTSTGEPPTGSSDDTGVTGTAIASGDDTTTSAGPDLTATSTGPGETTSTGPGETTGSSTGDTGSDDSSTGAAVCGCPDLEVPLDDGIFVLSDDAELWKFFPADNSFEMLGDLSCPDTSTFSMAVDRLGFAWVQFIGSGELRKVPVNDLTTCEDAGYAPGQQGVFNFGMAFVSNSAEDPCDRIYGNTYSGLGGYKEGPNLGDFIEIDPDSLQLDKLAKTDFDGAELTGTGDGRAFIFGGANPSKLVEVDKSTGDPVDTLLLDGVEINNSAFAFAFFGGDFYFFTDSNVDFVSSEVTHLDFDDSDMNGEQDITVVVPNAPLLIVGAGVSTCAPFAPQ
jgi:hypothetical protein